MGNDETSKLCLNSMHRLEVTFLVETESLSRNSYIESRGNISLHVLFYLPYLNNEKLKYGTMPLFTCFLAHLSRRLIGELIVYPWSGVLPAPTMLKHLLLRNHLANESQILCGASLGRGNEKLFTASGSHDQDDCHAHIWQKPFKNLLQNRRTDYHETWFVASGTPAHHSLFK